MRTYIGSPAILIRLVAIALAVAVPGCGLVHTTTQLPGKAVSAVTPGSKPKPTLDPVEAQQNLIRFADEFSGRVLIALDGLQRGTNRVDTAEILRWKIALATQVSSIASGPNAIANLLDMTAFVTLTRMALEQHWQPNVYGESIHPMVEICRTAETDIWRMAAGVLSPDQQKELRGLIQEWYRQNPLPETVVATRALGFSSQLQQNKPDAGRTGGVFDLLNLDPLAGLDPATREIAQTRLFAERALYIAHRTPLLLRFQAELTAIDSTRIPAVQQLLTNSAQVSSSVERFAGIAEKLPDQLSTERAEILKAVQAQQGELATLAGQVKETLQAGSQMSTSLNTTLTTLDTVMARFGVGQTNLTAEVKTNTEPFRIQDYTQSAAQLEATAKQLTELLLALDHTVGTTNMDRLSAQAGQVVQQAQLSGKELINYIFLKSLLFLVIALAALLGYRFLSVRLFSKPGSAGRISIQ